MDLLMAVIPRRIGRATIDATVMLRISDVYWVFLLFIVISYVGCVMGCSPAVGV